MTEEIPNAANFHVPEPSGWQMTLGDFRYRPTKGKEPNCFHRWMQELCFGVKWERVA